MNKIIERHTLWYSNCTQMLSQSSRTWLQPLLSLSRYLRTHVKQLMIQLHMRMHAHVHTHTHTHTHTHSHTHTHTHTHSHTHTTISVTPETHPISPSCYSLNTTDAVYYGTNWVVTPCWAAHDQHCISLKVTWASYTVPHGLKHPGKEVNRSTLFYG